MKDSNIIDYYKDNEVYAGLLRKLPWEYYEKYIFYFKKFLKSQDEKCLDVGCGVGTVVKYLLSDGLNAYGCDVSDLFINSNKELVNNLTVYDGQILPFDSDYFDVCGSFNVLEHVENPELFITEMNRVLKKGGVGIIVCPNFMSSFFRLGSDTTDTFLKRLKNFFIIVKMLLTREDKFTKMERIKRENFIEDDDAIVKTNIISITNFLRRSGKKILYISGVTKKYHPVLDFISRIYFVRLFLSSCFIVYRK